MTLPIIIAKCFLVAAVGILTIKTDGECNVKLTAKNGELTSPNYNKDKTYPPKSNCRWVIETDTEHEINLKFEDFKLESHSECRYDYVTIKGSQVDSREKYCGDVSPNGKNSQRVIKSSGKTLTVEFVADTSKQERGFKARWWITKRSTVKPSECGGEFSGDKGTLTSPSYPRSTLKQIICTWRITVPEGYTVRFVFEDLDIQNHYKCSTGYVQIKDRIQSGYDESLGVYCGRLLPSPITSKSNTVEIGFLSDKNTTTRGFKAKWMAYESGKADEKQEKDTPCNSVLRKPAGNIIHNIGSNCRWTIELPPNKRVVLTVLSVELTDDPTCYKETLQAKEDSSVLFRTCGNLKPQPVVSFTNRVLIEHVVRERRLIRSKFLMQWESIDDDVNSNIFDIGSCLTSSLPEVTFKSDKGSRKGIEPKYIPWMVQLQSSIHCAGAIISPQWVVSAAHCFIKMPIMKEWLVRAGDPSFFSEDGSEQIASIREIIFHPNYNNTSFDNDVVLLRLKTKLKFDSRVRSICLPESDINLTDNQECSISGWGTTKYLGKPREKLFQVFPKVVNRARCNERKMYDGRVTPNMLCAGRGGYDSCQGDGGSPLVCVARGHFFTVGLASWGNGCAGKYGVYTDLRKQTDWIKRVMNRKN